MISTAALDALQEIERRLLWLAVRMIDHANRGPDAGGIKVGGHQASSTSMVSIMTALWFAHLRREDKVAIKPHASPVYHAIKYLTGELDRSYLTRLRRFKGLQSYPSRTKDPDVSDFSTGSVGLGAVAPLFSAATRRYVDAHFGDRPTARFIATLGDAELDEGNVWEAIADPAMAELGNTMLIVDFNRQSLDRVVPGIQASRLQQFFANAGWHVVEAKYGARLQKAFQLDGGEALREHLDAMPNEAYQALFGLEAAQLRQAFLDGAPGPAVDLVAEVPDDELRGLVFNLAGHDLSTLIETFRHCDAETMRPSVVFAYTIKGWGLPTAGNPLNHAALLTEEQINQLRAAAGLTFETEWDRFDPDSAAGTLCEQIGRELNNAPCPPRPALEIAAATPRMSSRRAGSTQEAFGRVLSALADEPEIAERVVTVSPDVSISTNLGGWINKVGVFAPEVADDYGGAERLLKWAPAPSGRHIELGISEMNLFLLLGQLGLAHEHHGEMLIPIGTVYDPFVLRGLDAFVYGTYNGSRFIVVGTPSGVTLAPEGGAHQSTITASVGMELPGVTFHEPAYGQEVDWLLRDAIRHLAAPEGASTYLRLSTRPVDQGPFMAALDRLGEQRLRQDVVAGGYRLREPHIDSTHGAVTLAATGAVVPNALAAAEVLESEGVAAAVINLTSADRLFRGWRAHTGHVEAGRVIRPPSHLHRLIPSEERSHPIISVHDAASHALGWLGSALQAPQVALGVERFGESGSIDELHDATGISSDGIVTAALIALCE